MINNYKIVNLFGFRTVDIPFNDNVKILIGENGLGKTTVLNSLYYVLNKKYSKLVSIEFESIQLKFENGNTIEFSKLELEDYLEFKNSRSRRNLPSLIEERFKSIDFSNLENLLSKKCNTPLNDINHRNLIMKFLNDHEIPRFAPIDRTVREVHRYISEPKYENFDQFDQWIDELNISLLYLPTYRRVEEDIKNLGNITSDHDDFDLDFDGSPLGLSASFQALENDTLIHFGMEDVEQTLRYVEKEINKLTVIGFSKLTGEMLSQLLKGFPNIDDEIDDLDIGTVKIILHRVGDNLPISDRENIIRLLEDKKSLKEKAELVYFISKLIGLYNQHKHLDDSVKSFCAVCNNYLSDKEFIYDESSVNIDIYRKSSSAEAVKLSNLSSGEKQIVSIFSRIFLKENRDLIVLFDEPELSLSLLWQEQLLPDIINSNKCRFMLCVTHSPFIFHNNLESDAVSMSAYVSESIHVD